MIQFFQTIMGKAFYELHVPKIARSLERIAKSLEKLSEEQVVVAESSVPAIDITRDLVEGVQPAAPPPNAPKSERAAEPTFGTVFAAIEGGSAFLCEECATEAKVELDSEAVPTWEIGSVGWLGPVVCRDCGLSIPIYVSLPPVTEEP